MPVVGLCRRRKIKMAMLLSPRSGVSSACHVDDHVHVCVPVSCFYTSFIPFLGLEMSILLLVLPQSKARTYLSFSLLRWPRDSHQIRSLIHNLDCQKSSPRGLNTFCRTCVSRFQAVVLRSPWLVSQSSSVVKSHAITSSHDERLLSRLSTKSLDYSIRHVGPLII